MSYFKTVLIYSLNIEGIEMYTQICKCKLFKPKIV